MKPRNHRKGATAPGTAYAPSARVVPLLALLLVWVRVPVPVLRMLPTMQLMLLSTSDRDRLSNLTSRPALW
jgi:hypothetical protein